MRTERTKDRGFTLIELLVVISIIALLVAILMPGLSKAKQIAKKALCSTQMKGYAMATEMYATCNKFMMMDSYYFLDPNVGIPKYWGSNKMPENVGRCPGDDSTEQLGRLGTYPQFGSIRVSIGCNENMLSCSARATSVGPMAFWVNRDKISGQPSKLMTWADWQNNGGMNLTYSPVVKPIANNMGSLCFRHPGNVSNAAYLDGHVGEMQATIAVTNGGHDLDSGANWHITGSVPQLYKCYYPFGVGASQTNGDAGSRGDWPDMVCR